eukprot:5826091-Amphidinium_carterae.1
MQSMRRRDAHDEVGWQEHGHDSGWMPEEWPEEPWAEEGGMEEPRADTLKRDVLARGYTPMHIKVKSKDGEKATVTAVSNRLLYLISVALALLATWARTVTVNLVQIRFVV